MGEGFVQHVRFVRQIVLPWQTLSGLFWLFSGMLLSPVLLRMEWNMVALICAVVLARTSGMFWNRLLDSHFDRQNPRTAMRAVPMGYISAKNTFFYAIVTLSLFLLTCSFFSSVGWYLGLFVAVAVIVYSLLKRVTASCHLFLGLLHGLLPIVGSLWIEDAISTTAIALGVAAWASITGTDILYATQDEEVDRYLGLQSIPARFGTNTACKVAIVFHVIATVFLVVALIVSHAGIASFGFLAVALYMLWLKWERMAFSFFLLFFSATAFFIAGIDRICRVL